MNDIFAGTAWYYARYRPGYPNAVLERLRTEFDLDGTGRLLDLGCGTGELARSLSQDVEEAIGVDASPDMLTEARLQAEAEGITNVQWVCQRAEDLPSELGPFRLTTIGNSFHWMDQRAVLDDVYRRTGQGGVAILGNPGGIWSGHADWERVVRDVLVHFLGPRRMTRSGPFDAQEGAEWRTLRQSRFTDVTRVEYRWSRPVDADVIIGELYSTSFANKALLGDQAEEFEREVRRSLFELSPAGQFVQHLCTEYMLGFK